MRFVQRVPGPDLAPFVESIWLFDAPEVVAGARERLLPSGTAQLLVNLHEDRLRHDLGERFDRAESTHGAAIAGPHDAPFAIHASDQRRIVGVVFRPGGLRAFLRHDVEPLAGEHVPLDDAWGRDGAVLRERLLETDRARGDRDVLATLETALRERRSDVSRDRALERAIAALEGGATIRAAADAIGASDRSLLRRFRASIGLTPKRWARVRRFQRVLEAVCRAPEDVRWSRVAAEHGYADHAHLVHEFRALAGIAPSAYPLGPVEMRNHVVL